MSVDGILRVPYNLPGSQYWQWVNIYTRLSQERIVFLNQPLTDGVANSIVSALLYLESEDSTKPIYLYINSLGDPVLSGMASMVAGSVSILAGLAIYDTLRHIKSPVYTICLGQAVGMSALLLSAGIKGHRASLPHASIVLDHPRLGNQGQATDLQVMSREVLAKKESHSGNFLRNDRTADRQDSPRHRSHSLHDAAAGSGLWPDRSRLD